MRDEEAVVGYYRRLESRWGYRLILNGRRHLGYYPSDKRRLSVPRAQRLMED
ncbi:hypothetical protein [Nonomuraea lactucae]|uniref:hypothetical protein n=1 Tax=Nonomuraea lactucae TaxID=2249762 RepID=UPI0013B3AE33|nr:hypothetical protein [Nonomuraea lactucae]